MGLGGRGSAAVVALVVALVVGGCSSDSKPSAKGKANANANTKGRMSLLFVAGAAGGSLTPVAGQTNRYTLTLRGVEPSVTWFSDRPARASGREATKDLAGKWASYGFAREHPNAALDVGGPGGPVTVVELAPPRYDEAAHTLTFDATLLSGGAREGLEFAKGRTAGPPSETFDAATLFIDDGDVPASIASDGHLSANALPMLYVTFSGESSKGGVGYPNVVGVAANGSETGNILQGIPDQKVELRGMTLDAAGNLYVANSQKTVSKIYVFGPQNGDGTRTYTGTYASPTSTAGLDHPYGLAFVAASPTAAVGLRNLVASSQDTCLVTQFVPSGTTTGTPAPVASWLTSTYRNEKFPPGTLVSEDKNGSSKVCTVGAPQVEHGLYGPRGVTTDTAGNLYVADNPDGKVRVYNLGTGEYVKDLVPPSSGSTQPGPVGLYLSGSTLYVSSENTNQISAIDIATGTATVLVPGQSLQAPSGLTCGPDGMLYVNDRKAQKLYQYDLLKKTATEFASFDNPTVNDTPEQIIVASGAPGVCNAPS